MLENAGAQGSNIKPVPQPPDNSQASGAAEALARTLPLLAKTGPRFFKEGGGCSGCHHQPMEARVFAAASAAHVRWMKAYGSLFEISCLPNVLCI